MKATDPIVFILVSILALFSGGVAVQAQERIVPTIALDEDELKESVSPGAMIAGSVVAGVLVRGTAVEGVSLMGYVPADWRDQRVCAQVASIDGLYEAVNNYRVPAAWEGGIALFDFPTEYRQLLVEMPQDGLAVRVTPGQCGRGGTGQISVALWNAFELHSVDLLLNSFRADSVFVYVADRPEPVRCVPLDHLGRISFDSKCTLDLDGLGGTVVLEIYRLVGGKPAKPDSVTLRLPEG